MTDEKQENNTVQLPVYEVAEHCKPAVKSIFYLNIEELVYEKMVVMFEKLQPLEKELFDAKNNLTMQKQKLIRETNFEKELGKTRTNKDEREAYIKPLLVDYENKVDELQDKVTCYKTKLEILNDLIKVRRTQLKIEAELNE